MSRFIQGRWLGFATGYPLSHKSFAKTMELANVKLSWYGIHIGNFGIGIIHKSPLDKERSVAPRWEASVNKPKREADFIARTPERPWPRVPPDEARRIIDRMKRNSE